jgi:hypothetical protein
VYLHQQRALLPSPGAQQAPSTLPSPLKYHVRCAMGKLSWKSVCGHFWSASLPPPGPHLSGDKGAYLHLWYKFQPRAQHSESCLRMDIHMAMAEDSSGRWWTDIWSTGSPAGNSSHSMLASASQIMLVCEVIGCLFSFKYNPHMLYNFKH